MTAARVKTGALALVTLLLALFVGEWVLREPGLVTLPLASWCGGVTVCILVQRLLIDR